MSIVLLSMEEALALKVGDIVETRLSYFDDNWSKARVESLPVKFETRFMQWCTVDVRPLDEPRSEHVRTVRVNSVRLRTDPVSARPGIGLGWPR